MRRVISVWAPRLAAERALRARRRFCAAPSGGWGPFAVVAEEKGALRLAAVDQAAQAAGLARGMGLADARAIRPDLLTAPADPEGDRAFLVGLARWAGRYSPWVGIDGPEALSIDVTGCAHLFGGEAALLADLAARLTAFGLTARLGLADSRSGAWALAWAQEMRRGEQTRAEAGGGAAAVRAPEAAWSGAPGAIAPPGGSAAALAALPIGALRLTPAETAGLERLGLRRIGELLAQPRGPLARRFGAGLLRRLDQALAAEPDPIAPLGPAPIFAVRLSAPEPLMRREDVRRGLERLLARLCARLEDAGRGARGFELALRRADGGTMRAEIGLARPGRDPARIAPLFDAALERMTAAFGIDALRLEARAVEPLTHRQSHAGPAFRAGSGGGGAAGAGLEGDALDALLTRLGGRLGFDRLTRLRPAESHAPDASWTAAAAGAEDAAPDWPGAAAARPPRPLCWRAPEPIRLAEGAAAPAGGGSRPPAAFEWRGRLWRVAAAAGPERIAPEWWRDAPAWRSGLRDYWRVETEEGLRLWLHHLPQAPPGAADWLVCGLFA